MKPDFYGRLRELEKMIQLHFSDLGIVGHFEIQKLDRVALMEPFEIKNMFPMNIPISSFVRYGFKINIQFCFNPIPTDKL